MWSWSYGFVVFCFVGCTHLHKVLHIYDINMCKHFEARFSSIKYISREYHVFRISDHNLPWNTAIFSSPIFFLPFLPHKRFTKLDLRLSLGFSVVVRSLGCEPNVKFCFGPPNSLVLHFLQLIQHIKILSSGPRGTGACLWARGGKTLCVYVCVCLRVSVCTCISVLSHLSFMRLSPYRFVGWLCIIYYLNKWPGISWPGGL